MSQRALNKKRRNLGNTHTHNEGGGTKEPQEREKREEGEGGGPSEFSQKTEKFENIPSRDSEMPKEKGNLFFARPSLHSKSEKFD